MLVISLLALIRLLLFGLFRASYHLCTHIRFGAKSNSSLTQNLFFLLLRFLRCNLLFFLLLRYLGVLEHHLTHWGLHIQSLRLSQLKFQYLQLFFYFSFYFYLCFIFTIFFSFTLIFFSFSLSYTPFTLTLLLFLSYFFILFFFFFFYLNLIFFLLFFFYHHYFYF